MKITKQRLKEIIREELTAESTNYGRRLGALDAARHQLQTQAFNTAFNGILQHFSAQRGPDEDLRKVFDTIDATEVFKAHYNNTIHPKLPAAFAQSVLDLLSKFKVDGDLAQELLPAAVESDESQEVMKGMQNAYTLHNAEGAKEVNESQQKVTLTKQRLKEIIKEQVGKAEWSAYKLTDEDGPFVLSIPSKETHERYFRILGRDEGGSPHPRFGSLDDAHRYTSIDKAMNRQWWLKSYGAGEAEIEKAPALDEGASEKKHDHQAGLKVVSRDGKKKGWRTAGTWKSGKIIVKWKRRRGDPSGRTTTLYKEELVK